MAAASHRKSPRAETLQMLFARRSMPGKQQPNSGGPNREYQKPGHKITVSAAFVMPAETKVHQTLLPGLIFFRQSAKITMYKPTDKVYNKYWTVPNILGRTTH